MMPRHCILHIGTPKTGSTSIQHLLNGIRAMLPDQGVCYPATQADTKHMMLAAAFASSGGIVSEVGSTLWRGRDPATMIADYLAAFRAEMRALPPEIDRVILSAEHFSQFIRKPEDVARLHTLLSEFFGSFEVVVYLRRQDTHFVSMHAELLRAGKPSTQDMNVLSPFYHNYDYQKLIDLWASVFGDAAMRPRIFERAPGSNFEVVSDLLNICGVTMPPDAPAVEKERNPSMTLTGQRILQNVARTLSQGKNRSFASRAVWVHISRSVSEALPGHGWQPTRAEAASFMARFADSNEAVRKRWFPDRTALFSMDFSRLPENAPVMNDAADFNACCDVLLALSTRVARAHQPLVKAKVTQARKADNPDAYRAALVRAVKLDGSDFLARLQLARLQMDEGAFQPSRQNLTLVLKKQPGHALATKLLVRLDRLELRVKRKMAQAAAAAAPVVVDNLTSSYITNSGHCDGLVLGTGNCPITCGNSTNKP